MDEIISEFEPIESCEWHEFEIINEDADGTEMYYCTTCGATAWTPSS